MKKYGIIKNLPVMGKIQFVIVGFASLALLNLAIVLHYNAEQKKNSLAMEIASMKKMLSQMALNYQGGGGASANANEANIRNILQTNFAFIKVLKEGGAMPGNATNPIVLLPAEGRSLQTVLEVEKLWKAVEALANKSKEVATVNTIYQQGSISNKALNEQVLKADDALIAALNLQRESTESSLYQLMVIVLLAYVVFAAIFYRLFKKHIKEPIDEIKLYSQDLDQGTLQAKRKYYSDNELSVVIDQLDSVKQKIAYATEYAIGIGNDNYEQQLVVSENDQLSKALLLMSNKLTASAKEDQKRRWIAEGLTEFSQILRADSKNDLKELATKIISELVKYVKGNQGALFLLEQHGEEEYMELLACYAWNRNKFLSKKIRSGEGLVGQVWREADSIYLEEVPDNYIQIQSGLGEAPPKSIFILPLKTEDKVQGVLELAFLHKMEPHHRTFIEKLSENLASTFSVVKINQNTQNLLQVSQQQAEELRAQEEEMRQNMEELEATQEEMSRQKKEMETFNSAVDSSSVIVEFTSDGKFAHVNQKFMELTGYTREEVIGQSHEFYVPSAKIKSGSFQQLWEDIKSGKHFVRDVERLRKDGSTFWLRASYMPIYNEAGEFARISCICFDVTKEKLHEKEMDNFTNAVDNSSIIIDFNKDGKIIHINKKFVEVTGYSEEEMLGKPHSYYVPKEAVKSGVFEQLWEDLSKGEYFVRDVERVKKNGEHFWLRASYMPIFDENAALIKISCICFDITKEKLHEKEMNNFTNAVDNSSIIIDFNKDGKIVHINKKFMEVTGYTREEMIGQPHSYYVPKEAVKTGVFEKLWKDLSRGEHFVRDVERVKKNGEHFWLRASYMPIFDEQNNLHKISCICFDITEEKLRTI